VPEKFPSPCISKPQQRLKGKERKKKKGSLPISTGERLEVTKSVKINDQKVGKLSEKREENQ